MLCNFKSFFFASTNIKIRKVSNASGIQFVLLGLEHQEHIHYAMPMRIMGYDYSVYKKQYDKNAANYKTSIPVFHNRRIFRIVIFQFIRQFIAVSCGGR